MVMPRWASLNTSTQSLFQDPKLEVPTIYKAYFLGLCKGISPENMARNMVQYLHFRILKFPLINSEKLMAGLSDWISPTSVKMLSRSASVTHPAGIFGNPNYRGPSSLAKLVYNYNNNSV